jgi:NitT/TauT family transport system substrate-binding protein
VTAEWEKLGEGDLVQGCIVVSNTFKNEHPEQYAKFLAEYEASTEYVVTDLDASSKLIEKFGIIPKAPLAQKAIPNSNLTFLAGKEMKDTLVPFYQVLFNADESSLGKKLPADDFYYGA